MARTGPEPCANAPCLPRPARVEGQGCVQKGEGAFSPMSPSRHPRFGVTHRLSLIAVSVDRSPWPVTSGA